MKAHQILSWLCLLLATTAIECRSASIRPGRALESHPPPKTTGGSSSGSSSSSGSGGSSSSSSSSGGTSSGGSSSSIISAGPSPHTIGTIATQNSGWLLALLAAIIVIGMALYLFLYRKQNKREPQIDQSQLLENESELSSMASQSTSAEEDMEMANTKSETRSASAAAKNWFLFPTIGLAAKPNIESKQSVVPPVAVSKKQPEQEDRRRGLGNWLPAIRGGGVGIYPLPFGKGDNKSSLKEYGKECKHCHDIHMDEAAEQRCRQLKAAATQEVLEWADVYAPNFAAEERLNRQPPNAKEVLEWANVYAPTIAAEERMQYNTSEDVGVTPTRQQNTNRFAAQRTVQCIGKKHPLIRSRESKIVPA